MVETKRTLLLLALLVIVLGSVTAGAQATLVVPKVFIPARESDGGLSGFSRTSLMVYTEAGINASEIYVSINGEEKKLWDATGTNTTGTWDVNGWTLAISVQDFTSFGNGTVVRMKFEASSPNKDTGTTLIKYDVRVKLDNGNEETGHGEITIWNSVSFIHTGVWIATIGVPIGFMATILMYIIKTFTGAQVRIGLTDIVEKIIILLLIVATARALAGDDSVWNPIGFILNGVLHLRDVYADSLVILNERVTIISNTLITMYVPSWVLIIIGAALLAGAGSIASRFLSRFAGSREAVATLGRAFVAIGQSTIGALSYMIWWIAPILATFYTLRYVLEPLYMIAPLLAMVGLMLMNFPFTKRAGAYIFVFFLFTPPLIAYTIVFLENGVLSTIGLGYRQMAEVSNPLSWGGFLTWGPQVAKNILGVPLAVIFAVEIFVKAVVTPLTLYSIMIAVILLTLNDIAQWLGKGGMILEQAIMKMFRM